jgi:hypothetical protein
MPPFAGSCALPPHPEWIQVVLAAMVPVEITIADLEFGGSFPREGASVPNEIIVCWRSF